MEKLSPLKIVRIGVYTWISSRCLRPSLIYLYLFTITKAVPLSAYLIINSYFSLKDFKALISSGDKLFFGLYNSSFNFFICIEVSEIYFSKIVFFVGLGI